MARGGQGEGTRPGAEALARAAQDHGAEVVFANPGTTEMHLVGALDAPGLRLRPVLGLHETVSVFASGVSLRHGGTAGPRGGDSPSRPAAAGPRRTPDGAARGTLVVPPVSRGRGGEAAAAASAANPARRG